MTHLLRLYAIAMLLLLLLLGTSTDVSAGPVEPSKPSQIVTVTGSNTSASCPGSGNGLRVDAILKPEGGVVPFAIPSKSVFVVSNFDWRVAGPGLTAGRRVAVGVLAIGPNGELGTLAFSSGEIDPTGAAFGNGNPSDRMIVKPPATLCWQVPPGTTDGLVTVHGFFAKDK